MKVTWILIILCLNSFISLFNGRQGMYKHKTLDVFKVADLSFWESVIFFINLFYSRYSILSHSNTLNYNVIIDQILKEKDKISSTVSGNFLLLIFKQSFIRLPQSHLSCFNSDILNTLLACWYKQMQCNLQATYIADNYDEWDCLSLYWF